MCATRLKKIFDQKGSGILGIILSQLGQDIPCYLWSQYKSTSAHLSYTLPKINILSTIAAHEFLKYI